MGPSSQLELCNSSKTELVSDTRCEESLIPDVRVYAMGMLPPHPIPTMMRVNPYTKGIAEGARKSDRNLRQIRVALHTPE